MRLILVLTLFFVLKAGAEYRVPALTGPVMDLAGMLSPSTEREVEELIRAVHSAGGTQLQVLTVPTLDGTPIEQATIKTVEAWKLGSAKEDQGILLLIAAQERAMRIEVGQGREGVLPDVMAKRIISDVMIPHFKNGDVDRGVLAGVVYIFKYADPEILEKVSQYGVTAPIKSGKKKRDLPIFAFFIFLFIILQIMGFGRRRRGVLPFMTGYGLGSLGGGGFGGGGFGGSSGGGWSGGGGGFSGGGASGNW